MAGEVLAPAEDTTMLTKNCEPALGTKTAYDRGASDSYYGRARIPHIWINFQEVLVERGSKEWNEYMEGYDVNEAMENFKDWGNP